MTGWLALTAISAIAGGVIVLCYYGWCFVRTQELKYDNWAYIPGRQLRGPVYDMEATYEETSGRPRGGGGVDRGHAELGRGAHDLVGYNGGDL